MLQQCNAINYQHADSKYPLVAQAVIEWQDVVPASLITVTHRAYTIAFVGSAQGTLVKVIILQSEMLCLSLGFYQSTHGLV